MKRFWGLSVLAVCILGMTACTESDVIAVQVQLRSDLSGTVLVSSLMVPREGGPVERGSAGVAWDHRVNLVFSSGSFEQVSKLKVEDLTFSGGTMPDGFHYVVVTLPRGPQARWARTLAPLSAAERKKAAAAFDPENRLKRVGASVKLRVDLPAPAVGHGITPAVRGAEESVENTRAVLVLPLEVATGPGEPLKWHLTWQ